jgi:hypothetical protein
MHGSDMAIHRTVLRTYQQLWYSDQLKSRLATLDSSQEALLQVMCMDWHQHSQISQRATTSLWRFQAQEKLINSQHEAIKVQCPCRDIYILLFFSCWLRVYIHGQVTFCVHGLRSLDQWFCVSSSDSISACIIVSKSIGDGLIDKHREQVFPKMKAQSPWAWPW